MYEITHKLGNAECGVGIVYMDRNLIRKVVKRSVHGKVIRNYILKRCGHKEILLSKAEHLSLVVVIGRIQNL